VTIIKLIVLRVYDFLGGGLETSALLAYALSGSHLALLEKRPKQLNMKWEMLRISRHSFEQLLYIPKIVAHMMSLDLRISYDMTMPLIYFTMK